MLGHIRLISRAVYRDISNIVHYGRDAPRYAEQVWIHTSACRWSLPDLSRPVSQADTGRILGGEWDTDRIQLVENEIVRACLARWVDGSSWHEAGVFQIHADRALRRGEPRSDSDIAEWHSRLDAMFRQVCREGRLRTVGETSRWSFRANGGVLVHFDREGTLLFGGGGHHRLAAALAAGVDVIPVQVGVVHEDAVRLWRLSTVDGRKDDVP